MPTNRRHLTNAEERAHLARVQLLRESGVEIQVPPQAAEVPPVRMIQEGDPLSSIVCDLSCGGVGFVVWMSFVVMKSHLVIPDIGFRPGMSRAFGCCPTQRKRVGGKTCIAFRMDLNILG